MATSFSNQWAILHERDALVKLSWHPWEDVRQYQVYHSFTEQTRYNTQQDKITYDLAVAAHTFANEQPQIEILKHNFKINGEPPATFTQQIIVALQEAIFPYLFKCSKTTGQLQHISNYNDIKDEWEEKSKDIITQCQNKNVSQLIEKMANSFASQQAFEDTIKKELLVQLLFWPLYSIDLTLGSTMPLPIKLTHPILDNQIFNGTLALHESDETMFYIAVFEARQELHTPQQMEKINKLLSRHYPLHLIKPVTAVTDINISLKINANSGQIVNSNCNIETRVGDYFYQQEYLELIFTNNTTPVFDEENDYLKTLFLQTQTDVII